MHSQDCTKVRSRHVGEIKRYIYEGGEHTHLGKYEAMLGPMKNSIEVTATTASEDVFPLPPDLK